MSTTLSDHGITSTPTNGLALDDDRSTDNPASWPDPKPIPDQLRPVPELPAAIIPGPLRPWIGDIAHRLQVPVDYPAAASIVALASVVGNQVRIRPKRYDDWTVTPNLWGAIIGRPGVMKSPAIAEAFRPIRRLIKEAEAEHKEREREWAFEREAAEMRRSAIKDRMKRAAKSGGDLEAFRSELDELEIEPPTERRYLVNDSTVEKYGELLNRNPNGLLIFRDELPGWMRRLEEEQYARDRAFYLEAWEGSGSYVYDRIGRGTLKIEQTTTSIFGGIQPARLEVYLRNALDGGAGDDGLIQRFQVMVYPDIPRDWRNIDAWPDRDAKNRAFNIFQVLSAIDRRVIQVEQGDDDRPFLRFNDEAQEFFDAWLTDLNITLRSDEIDHPAIESHLAKYKKLVPGLSLIFQLADFAEKGAGSAIGIEAVKMAAAWGSYLHAHALRIYGLGLNSASLHAKTLANHLQAGDLGSEFTARDVYFRGWSGLSSAKAVTEPLDLLEALGWISSVDMPTGGRPKTIYLVNPKVQGGSR